MEYIGQIIVFLSALVAINGETWNKDARGIKKISLIGIITIIFALIGFIIAMTNTRLTSIENVNYRNKIDSTEVNTKVSKNELQKANGQIDNLNNQLSVYKEIIDKIKNESDRQDQTVMMEFVQLGPHEHWTSPSLIYSGSRIEFLGFEKGLIMGYGTKREVIPEWDGHAIETAIMGESGKGYELQLYNNSYRDIMGKVHVISSPRIRSNDRSWIEEKLSKIKSK